MKKIKKKQLFIIGAYGCGNRGDDAILQALTQQFPECNIAVTCGSFEDISEYFPVKAVPCRMNEGLSLSILISMFKDLFGILSNIIKCDALIYGGGSLIHDLTKYNLPFMYFWQFIAKLLGKKVFYACIGIGPLCTENGKRKSRYFLTKADGVFVRDNRGLKICKEIGVKEAIQVSDAAFLISQKNQRKGKTLLNYGLIPETYICVTASAWFESVNYWNKNKINFDNQISNLAESIRAIYQYYQKKIVFVPTVFHDKELAEKLEQHLSAIDFTIVSHKLHCDEMAEVIENSSILLGMRMHSIIFAIRQGVPVLAIIYDEKVNELLKSVGIEEYSINLKELSPEKLLGLAKKMEANKDEVTGQIRKKAKVFEEKAKSCIDVIKEAIYN